MLAIWVCKIIKLSVAYHNCAHGDVAIVLQKTSHTSTFEKEKQNFNSIVFMDWRPYGLVKVSSWLKFYYYSGFHVANSIYSMLKNSPGVFNPLEVQISNIVKALIIKLENTKEKGLTFQSLAMFIGALCHDLDHRGFNNKFMIDIG